MAVVNFQLQELDMSSFIPDLQLDKSRELLQQLRTTMVGIIKQKTVCSDFDLPNLRQYNITSFFGALLEIATSWCATFDTADRTIRSIDKDAEEMLSILMPLAQSTGAYKDAGLLMKTANRSRELVKRCTDNAREGQAKGNETLEFMMRVLEACVAAQGINADKANQLRAKLAVLKSLQKAQEEATRISLEDYERAKREVEDAKAQVNKANPDDFELFVLWLTGRQNVRKVYDVTKNVFVPTETANNIAAMSRALEAVVKQAIGDNPSWEQVGRGARSLGAQLTACSQFDVGASVITSDDAVRAWLDRAKVQVDELLNVSQEMDTYAKLMKHEDTALTSRLTQMMKELVKSAEQLQSDVLLIPDKKIEHREESSARGERAAVAQQALNEAKAVKEEAEEALTREQRRLDDIHYYVRKDDFTVMQAQNVLDILISYVTVHTFVQNEFLKVLQCVDRFVNLVATTLSSCIESTADYISGASDLLSGNSTLSTVFLEIVMESTQNACNTIYLVQRVCKRYEEFISTAFPNAGARLGFYQTNKMSIWTDVRALTGKIRVFSLAVPEGGQVDKNRARTIERLHNKLNELWSRVYNAGL